MEDNDIIFIARHYRKGKFRTAEGWRRLGIAPASRWRRIRVAAAVAGLVALASVAAALWRQYSEAPAPARQQVEQAAPPAIEAVKAIDFDDAPLTEVAAKIMEVYGVELTNLPANADDCRLSLHYEGNAADLVETINGILDTAIEIKQ